MEKQKKDIPHKRDSEHINPVKKSSKVISGRKYWYVYILECADGTYYTGITTDTERRVHEHNYSDIRGARYTRTRRPVKLVHCEDVLYRSEALKREVRIKKMTKAGKRKLAEGGEIQT